MATRMEINPRSFANITKEVQKKAQEIAKDVAIEIYNTIVAGGVDIPYWSGSYISSWNISVGSPDYSYSPRTGIPDSYSVPDPVWDLGGVGYNQKIYITNAAPHADKVEYEGTPTHPGGWYVATHAKNQVVMGYKVK